MIGRRAALLGAPSLRLGPGFDILFSGRPSRGLFYVGQLPATVLKNFHFSAVSNLKSAVMAKTELKNRRRELGFTSGRNCGDDLRDQLSSDAVLHVSAELRSRCANQLGMGALGRRVCSWYCDRPMARIGRVGKGAAVHSWSRGSLYSVRPRAPLYRCEQGICWRWTPIVILAVLAPTMWWLATKD
jgi:hypothetical protein